MRLNVYLLIIKAKKKKCLNTKVDIVNTVLIIENLYTTNNFYSQDISMPVYYVFQFQERNTYIIL